MRVPVSWLRELCDPGWDPERLAERLAMTGTEVERVTRIGPRSSEGFVVGSVLEVSPHPDADRLSVCEVATGGEQARTIVCGAPNVAAGQTVAVALPGAVLPDGTELGRAKLRGVVSDGMICSEAELELGDEHDGIMVLASGGAELAAPGAPLGELLALGDAVLELEVTPNRVDCLGVIGVGRELHAISGAPLAPPAWEQPEVEATGEGRVEEVASVRVEVPELCPRFTARAFTDVRVGPSPQWLRRRLAAAGQRPINNVVDITNYVMLLSAQPLHAFDLDRVPGGEVIVRRAAEGERMRTLDDVEHELDSETVVVADRERPSGIAGIMGGQASEVSEGTTRVLLEAATWNGVNILRSSSRLGLRSEASTRFEKQLHPELAIRAQRIAARLIVELCDARLVPGTIDVLADPVEPRRLALRPPRTDSLLGQATPAAEQAGRLERLGFGVAEHVGELEVTVPYERHFDVTREVDLIEEVARIGGLEELPATLPRGALAGGLSREQRLRRRAEDALRGQGIDEVKTWSFARADADERLGLDSDREPGPVVISNPLSEEGRAMRTSLLGGMVDVARLNVSRRIGRIAIFESGRVYLRSGEASVPGSPSAGDFAGLDPAPALEPHRLAVLLVGQAPSDW
ncbi:MAG: phenylalanine--tRNA ligase subunit beta, partial [Solirubrobacterales bacterium]|nr:phenylalanine--tRNA ligase subunit beta [Solirubrobacterales bacterium]